MSSSKYCIFIGNPLPELFLVNTVNKNFAIGDNIAQNELIDGLYNEYKENLSVITIAANFNNPKVLNKKTKKQNIKLDCGVSAVAVGNLNYSRILYFLSLMITYTIALYKIMHSMKKKDRNSKFLVVSNATFAWVTLPVCFAKIFYKICYIPFLIGSVELPELTGISGIISKLSKIMLKISDGTISYVEASSKDYTKKPYVTILYSLKKEKIQLSEEYINTKKENDKFTICYTGTLSKVNGIDKLMTLIKKTKGKYRWIICGTGEYKEDFQNLSEDKLLDMKYMGIMDNKEVIKLQNNSDLLILFRSVETNIYKYYSKYAASGKLVEYLLSGTPIITNNVESISKEIKPYLNFVDYQNINAVIERIENIKNEYKRFEDTADKGREYVKIYANTKYQNKKIIDFLENTYNKKYKL